MSTHLLCGIKNYVRQSDTRSRGENPSFPLFKSLPSKLRLFLDLDLVLGNEHGKNSYPFGLKKPEKKNNGTRVEERLAKDTYLRPIHARAPAVA